MFFRTIIAITIIRIVIAPWIRDTSRTTAERTESSEASSDKEELVASVNTHPANILTNNFSTEQNPELFLIPRVATGMNQRKMTRCNFTKYLASEFYNYQDLNSLSSE